MSQLKPACRLGTDETDEKSPLDATERLEPDRLDHSHPTPTNSATSITRQRDSIFSTPFDEVRTDNSVTTEGRKWINATDGNAYIFSSGVALAYAPNAAETVMVTDVGLFSAAGPGWLQIYDLPDHLFDNLNDADATAAKLGATLTITKEWTLNSDIAFSAAAIRFDGGAVDLEKFNLQFNSNAVIAAAAPIFKTTGIGIVKGKINSSTIRAEWFGAKGDGTTDNTAALQAAINYASGNGGTLSLLPGIYLVSGATNSILSVPASGLSLDGASPNRAIIKTSIASAHILTASSPASLDIKNIGFEGVDGNSVGISVTGAGTNIRILNCVTNKCALYYGISSAAGNQTAIKDDNSPNGVFISGCTGTGNKSSIVGLAFISLIHHWNTKIIDCTASYYAHGIQWWGGDAAVDGNPGAPRKAHDIVISKCLMRNMTGGGIWGSMGDRVNVSDCRVFDCGDVGIDFEGCTRSSANSCTIARCTNGCLATFYSNDGVTFNDCNATADNASPIIAQIFNNGTWYANDNITFNGGRWEYLGTSGSGVVKDASATGYKKIAFRNLSLKNVRFDMGNGQSASKIFEDIESHWTVSGAINAVQTGRVSTLGGAPGVLSITNVRVVSDSPMIGGAAFYLSINTNGNGCSIRVTGCKSIGWDHDFSLNSDAGISGTFVIQSCTTSNTGTGRGVKEAFYNPAIGSSALISNNNYSASGTPT